jgi:hypothetical protein
MNGPPINGPPMNGPPMNGPYGMQQRPNPLGRPLQRPPGQPTNPAFNSAPVPQNRPPQGMPPNQFPPQPTGSFPKPGPYPPNQGQFQSSNPGQMTSPVQEAFSSNQGPYPHANQGQVPPRNIGQFLTTNQGQVPPKNNGQIPSSNQGSFVPPQNLPPQNLPPQNLPPPNQSPQYPQQPGTVSNPQQLGAQMQEMSLNDVSKQICYYLKGPSKSNRAKRAYYPPAGPVVQQSAPFSPTNQPPQTASNPPSNPLSPAFSNQASSRFTPSQSPYALQTPPESGRNKLDPDSIPSPLTGYDIEQDYYDHNVFRSIGRTAPPSTMVKFRCVDDGKILKTY